MKPGIPLDSLNWFIMFLSLSVVWYVMRDISRRLGDALHLRKYYLLYDVCEFVLIGCIVLLFFHLVLEWSVNWMGAGVYPKLLKLLFLGAALVEVGVTLKYWGWIVAEVLRPVKK